ncbi:hypothetical protein FQN57_000839 [Myotisia sp. PD_48]|nr:hypothetical protein FQN57_000839 [Myotisia sp. PD_48]
MASIFRWFSKVKGTEPVPRTTLPERPSQTKFIRDYQMSLFADLVSWPPLGQVTFLQRTKTNAGNNKLTFSVVLGSKTSLPELPWNVAIWHNVHSNEWEELELQKCPAEAVPVAINDKPDDTTFRYLFSGTLDFPSHGKQASFTIKYRTDASTPWQWANHQFGTKDGELIFEPPQSLRDHFTGKLPPEYLEKYIEGLNPNLKIESRRSDSPDTALWSITGPVRSAESGSGKKDSLVLGTPKDYIRNFSIVRIWSPWLAPRHGANSFHLTEDSLMTSFLHKDGVVLVLLAVSGIENVLTVFQSGQKGEVVLVSQNDNPESATVRILAALAPSFDLANAAVMYEARKIASAFSQVEDISAIGNEDPKPSSSGDVQLLENDEPKAQWMSSWYDGLTYCTWNALGQNLTDKKILNALELLKANKIKISTLIIDDNWQSLDNKDGPQFKRGMTRFDANEEGFPNGLKATMSEIRQKNPHIKHIAVWHALMGYWGGISPTGEIASKYKTTEVTRTDRVADGKMTVIDPDNIAQFFNDFYAFLSSAGVDAVKTDAQFYLDLIDSPKDRVRFMTAYQDAWCGAILRQFQGKAISCMSQTPQIIFHSLLPRNKPCFLWRNSDDFFPNIEKSHLWHVFCNAHNAVLTRYLNVIPDWDMFQTVHDYASFHAAARCVSGGAIYITDEPGKHDFNLINLMTAPTPQGDTIILRPSVPGRAREVFHNYNEAHILRIGTFDGWAKTGSGILGLFNIGPATLSGLVHLGEFPGILHEDNRKYIIRAHSTGKISRIMEPADSSALVSVTLAQRGWEILTMYPIYAFGPLDKSGNDSRALGSPVHVAVLGLLDKMTGVAAIVDAEISQTPTHSVRFKVSLKALGVFGVFISDLETREVENNFMVLLQGRAVPVELVVKGNCREACVLSVDILKAWEMMGLEGGWNNEVSLEIYMS